MYAVIETGGKQYRVKVGDQLRVEKLKVEDGAKVEFDKILAVGEGADVEIGTPYVEAANVVAEAVETGKGEKVIIFKYKSKKDYRKKQGHRQPYTLVEIKEITANGKTEKAPAKAAAPKAEAKKEEPKAAVTEEAPKKTPSLKSMKKAELIAFAKDNNIEIDEKATNAVMIETIENALK